MEIRDMLSEKDSFFVAKTTGTWEYLYEKELVSDDESGADSKKLIAICDKEIDRLNAKLRDGGRTLKELNASPALRLFALSSFHDGCINAARVDGRDLILEIDNFAAYSYIAYCKIRFTEFELDEKSPLAKDGVKCMTLDDLLRSPSKNGSSKELSGADLQINDDGYRAVFYIFKDDGGFGGVDLLSIKFNGLIFDRSVFFEGAYDLPDSLEPDKQDEKTLQKNIETLANDCAVKTRHLLFPAGLKVLEARGYDKFKDDLFGIFIRMDDFCWNIPEYVKFYEYLIAHKDDDMYEPLKKAFNYAKNNNLNLLAGLKIFLKTAKIDLGARENDKTFLTDLADCLDDLDKIAEK
ncbi:MAG: hypothetical protein LBP26_01025 [Clostridiales bacterium]|jgi:hypothetical protein|nr:hypothetical protein [Clostridiales bacterium]